MPLPSPSGKEKRKDFVSRCVSDLAKKGEGNSTAQRVAMCNSQFKKAKSAHHDGDGDSKKKKKKGSKKKDY